MGIMRNKSDCFEILWVFSQRDGITSFLLFYGPKHQKAAFFACAILQIFVALARSVVNVQNKHYSPLDR